MSQEKVAVLLSEGLRRFSVGDLEGATRSWQEALAIDPSNGTARSYLGLLHEEPAPVFDEFPLGGGELEPVGHGSEPADVFSLIEATPSEPIAYLVMEEGRPEPEPGRDEADVLVEGAGELFGLGDFSGSLELIQKALALDPCHTEALAYLERNEGTLLQMYESRLGNRESKPWGVLRPDEIVWLNLDAKAGFVLSLVDGTLSVDDLYDVSSLGRLETARILSDLVDQGVIAI